MLNLKPIKNKRKQAGSQSSKNKQTRQNHIMVPNKRWENYSSSQIDILQIINIIFLLLITNMQVNESEFEEESLEIQVDENQNFTSVSSQQKAKNKCKLSMLLIAFLMIGSLMVIEEHFFNKITPNKNQIEKQLIEEVLHLQNNAQSPQEESQRQASIKSEEKSDLEQKKLKNKEQSDSNNIDTEKSTVQNQIQKQNSLKEEESPQKSKQPVKKSAKILLMLKNRQFPNNYAYGADREKQLPVCVIRYKGSQKIQQQTLGYPLTIVQTKMEDLFVEESNTKMNLTYLNEKIHQRCVRNSIIFFLSQMPTQKYLNELSLIYQTKKIWATFSQSNDSIKIVSVYQRMLILAQHNYLTGSQLTSSILDTRDLTLDLLEMSLNNIYQRKSEPFDFNHNSLLNVSLSWEKIGENRPKYDSILSMKQFSKINKKLQYQHYMKMINNQEGYKAETRGLKQEMMQESVQLRELVYLPVNHSLQSREKKIKEYAYNLSQYSIQKPLCVFIPSHNNIQDNRYQRVIDSILQQQYSNYHIVFIDDYSDDSTLSSTMHFLDKLGFPRDRVAYVQNLRKNYATYNIVNGAFNYCKADDIMVLVDGDDELVGRQVFKLINAGYQNRPVWLLWTTFTSNIYTYGSSKPIGGEQGYLNAQKKRKGDHWIGHLTTFYAGFFRYIKIEAHQCLPGEWFDTLYDDAMQHPLIEMATIEHLSFIREMTYLYNKNYGNNDDSSQWKKFYRRNLYYSKVFPEEPYPPLQSLDFSYKNQVIQEQLEKDRNVRYKDIESEADIVKVTDNIEMDYNGPCQQYIRSIANQTQF